MCRDAYVVPATFALVFVSMVGTDVVHVGLRSFTRPEHGDWVGRHQAGDFAVGITNVAKYSSASDAGIDACRIKSFRYSVDAEIAFISEASHRVEKSSIIRAGLDTVLATDAQTTVDHHDAILWAFISCVGRAHVHALGMTAVVT